MKFKTFILAMACASSLAPQAAFAEDDNVLAYVRILGDTFELQIQAIEYVLAEGGVYTSNAVRHSMDILSTADMLNYVVGKEMSKPERAVDMDKWPWSTREEFVKLSEANWQAAKDLVGITENWVATGNNAGVAEGVQHLRRTCEACHSGDNSLNK
ncbi:MAG: cytochrome c [Alphaproteobacteria bacterium]|nr:cytochrome c [Alphaproteobacteria bacterium]MBF0250151.1 cytochrome c [Alphaproteobacteria bacterium]